MRGFTLGKVAVLIDGGFYRKRAAFIWGHEPAEEAANSLVNYAKRHVKWSKSELYRIFYYDCPAADFPVPVSRPN